MNPVQVKKIVTSQVSVNKDPGMSYSSSTRNLPSAPVPTTADRLKEIDRLVKSRDMGTLSGEEGSKMYRLIAEQQVEDKRGGGASIVRNQTELDDLFKTGKVTQSQYDAAKIRLDSGQAGGGLDPTGFNASEVLEQQGQVGRENPLEAAVPNSPMARAKVRQTSTERAKTEADAIIAAENKGRTKVGIPGLSTQEQTAIRESVYQQELAKDQMADLEQQKSERQADRSAAMGGGQQEAVEKNAALSGIASGIDDAALTQVLGALPPGSEWLGSALQAVMDSQDDVEGMQQGLANYSVGLAGQVYNQQLTRLDASSMRAEGLFKSAEKIFEESRDRKSSLYAQQQQELMNQFDIERDRLVFDQERQEREAKRTLSRQIDKMTTSLALRGGFGSEDGMAEIREAETAGEDAIRDISREFNLSHRDLLSKAKDATLKFTQLQGEAEDKFSVDWLSALKDYSSRMDTLDLQYASNETSYASSLQTATKDFVTAVGTARKEKAQTILDFANDVAKMASEERKNGMKDMMSTKDKLGYTTGLRTEINNKQTIKVANDVDGFYGAMNSGYDEYQRIKSDPNATEESLNAASTTVVGSFARILDPGSVVRNEEYERQMFGQAFLNQAKGAFEKLKRGGAGLTAADMDSMKKVADKIHTAWEDRLARDMQPIIMSIDSWNSSYPEDSIDYGEVFDVNRIHLPEQTLSTWETAANGTGEGTTTGLGQTSSLFDFFSVYAPSADNNNPKAYASAVAKELGVTANTKLGELESRVPDLAQAIANHEGFTSGASRLAVENNNPGNLRFIGQQGATRGRSGFAKFASVEAGWNALENDIRAKIGGTSRYSKPTRFSLIPSAEAASPDDEIVFEGSMNDEEIIPTTISSFGISTPIVQVRQAPPPPRKPSTLVAYPTTAGTTLLSR